MKKYIILLLSLVISLPLLAQDDDPGYYFDKYTVDMVVHENNTVDVTENIDVVFTMRSRGIFRIIPRRVWVKRDVSDNQDGSKDRMMRYWVDINNATVSETWTKMEETGDTIFGMRIGKSDVFLEGPHSYTIQYQIEIPGDRLPQSDLFYYSVLGSGWDCRTNTFMFTIHFDKPLTDKEVSGIKAFTGNERSAGSETNRASSILVNVSNTDLSGGATSIPPRSAITLFVPLHEGYFTNGTHPGMEVLLCNIFIGLTLILLIYILYRELFGSKSITKVVTFYPPKGCSSLEVGTLIDTSVDDQDVISLIPWFAEQGYLTIDNSGSHPVLHKVKDLPDNAPDYQKILFNGFFKDGHVFRLGDVGKNFGNAWLDTKKKAESSFKGKLDDTDWFTYGLLILDIFFVSMATCWATNDHDGWIIGGVLSVAYAIASFIQISYGCDNNSMKGLVGSAVFTSTCLLWNFGLIYFIYHTADDPWLVDNPTLLYIALIGVGLACIFASSLAIMTPYRRQRIGEILGLHEFISTADKQQLEHLQAGDEKYFYKVLPYAVAFGMAQQWAKRFDGIKITPVDWYKDSSTNPINGLADFTRRGIMSQSMKQSIKSEQNKRDEAARAAARAASSRSSSGSSWSSSSSHSSGGFSGGGFGGGGGGRW